MSRLRSAVRRGRLALDTTEPEPATSRKRPATEPATSRKRPATEPATSRKRPATEPATSRKRPATEPATEPATSRKRPATASVKSESPDGTSSSTYHRFHDPAEIEVFRTQLLDWYDQSKRALPWRTTALTEPDINIRTYAVWVSEIMLQQTQVATVIDYYKKWMKRWPTVQDLAAASLEEVNQMWAGLGYYSRGKRLHEGAQKVVSQLNGEMPRTVEALLKLLPGVGRYTAGAVGSIALGQVTGVVDGNVIRVLCRVRAIGADSTSPPVTQTLWSIANTLVDQERPGDFNQAMMELGAKVCTPKGALCSECPVRSHCHSFRKAHLKQEQRSNRLFGKPDMLPKSLPDIEDCMTYGPCALCPAEPWDSELGVHNFPRKPVKKPPRVERTLTCVVARPGDGGQDQYMLTQRPSKGLLAGMWEFPSLLLEGDSSEMRHKGALCAAVGRMLGIRLNKGRLQYVGEVLHRFSHIQQTYVVYSVCVEEQAEGGPAQCETPQCETTQCETTHTTHTTRWLTRPALQEAAVSTAVSKIMKMYETMGVTEPQTKRDCKKKTAGMKKEKKLKSKLNAQKSGSRQLLLNTFLQIPKQQC